MTIKVAHIITGLDIGGAEMMLYKLLSGMDRRRFDTMVVSLTKFGMVAEMIRQLGVPVMAMGMEGSIQDGLAQLSLVNTLRTYTPDVVQTWMYHANLVGGLATRLAGNPPLVWGMHHGNLRFEGYRRSTLLVAQVAGVLSSVLPARIVCCSQVSKETHASLGYAQDRLVVIPNGFDGAVFKPDQEARKTQRSLLGISEEIPLIGCVARFHPQKDHRTFIKAAALLHATMHDVHFLLCGPRIGWDNTRLARWIREAGLEARFHLFSPPQDLPQLTAAFDIATLSSMSEAFPNAIGEAMACGVPCVVTDVGDAAAMVGATGVVVPIADPEALAAGWRKMLELDKHAREGLGESARKRVLEHYSLTKAVASYQDLYGSLVAYD